MCNAEIIFSLNAVLIDVYVYIFVYFVMTKRVLFNCDEFQVHGSLSNGT